MRRSALIGSLSLVIVGCGDSVGRSPPGGPKVERAPSAAVTGSGSDANGVDSLDGPGGQALALAGSAGVNSSDSISFANFATLRVHSAESAKVTIVDGTEGFKKAPVKDVRVEFPKHSFVITDRGCQNGELSINGSKVSGWSFAVYEDGTHQVVTTAPDADKRRGFIAPVHDG